MNEILKALIHHEVFSGLSEEELKNLIPILSRKNYSKGDIVFDSNQKANFLFFIEKGNFTLLLGNNEYKKLTSGQLFGEVGILNMDFRTGTVTCSEDAEVIRLCGTKLFQEEFIPATIALKIVRKLGKRVTDYLRSKEQISTKEIIAQGESDHVEFKSTLRWNLYTNKKDKAIENAALKTLVAFMNSEGGVLIIGVKDDGTYLGLAQDQFANDDKLLLHLTKIIKDRIGTLFMNFLHFSIEILDNKKILRIDCQPGIEPAYLKDGQHEHFYIRTGPSTTDLKLSKVYPYIKERFEKK